jgi:hypothetical protein
MAILAGLLKNWRNILRESNLRRRGDARRGLCVREFKEPCEAGNGYEACRKQIHQTVACEIHSHLLVLSFIKTRLNL